MVAPLAGARIEIQGESKSPRPAGVAPLAGARIEIHNSTQSPPVAIVAPLAGARIEIHCGMILQKRIRSRSPRGSAD